MNFVAGSLRLAGPCLIVFTLLIGGTRLLPPSAPDLAAFNQLFPASDACDSFCLLGIRPGMPLAEAVELLRANQWIRGVSNPNVFNYETYVYWNWSGTQPDVIDTRVPGELYARSETDENGHYVVSVSVDTRLRLETLRQGLGTTTNGSAWWLPTPNQITYQVSYYDEAVRRRITLGSELECPLRLLHYYWHPHTRISQSEGQMLMDYVLPQMLPALCRQRSAG